MNQIVKNIFFFIVLILLQILVFSNIDYLGFVCPFIYLLFILNLPMRYSVNTLMILAFAMGIIIDSFENTMGIHTAAYVLIAFVRNTWISFIIPKSDNKDISPSIINFGIFDYSKYALGLIFLHHTTLFFLESMSFDNIGNILLRICINTVLSFLLILIYEFCKKR